MFSNNKNSSRVDYLLIWGNGQQYKEDILSILDQQAGIRILRIVNYHPKDIDQFVREIYSHDYAPFEHLKAKTEYLMKSEPNVTFVFFENSCLKEEFYGDGDFKHIQCTNLKIIKEVLRNKFNPRKKGQRTEQHVVHISDNEKQVDYALRLVGIEEGIQRFYSVAHPLLDTPYHITPFKRVTITKVPIDQLVCHILKTKGSTFDLIKTPIEKTPHYLCLTGNSKPFENYLKEFKAGLLTDNHSVDNLIKLSKKFTYLKPPHQNKYILVEEIRPNQFLIQDGVHRASILKYQGYNSAIVAIMNK